MGVIPVARGRANPEAVRCMVEHIVHGRWGGIFPEGEVYFSRNVMPMEYGAVRIAMDAALEIQRAAKEKGRTGSDLRSVFITPFAHVYLLSNPSLSIRRAGKALDEMDAHPMVRVAQAGGDLPARIRRVADRLLENKAGEYGIPRREWHSRDRFERTRRLQDAVLGRLENEYIGQCETGYARRRAMKVRMACFERLSESGLSVEEQKKIEKDVRKTRELILMTPFSRAYRVKYGDLEMWIEYMQRIRSALDMTPFNFGPQQAVYKVHSPIDVQPIAATYDSLASEDLRLSYLYERTEQLREIVQAGVDEICKDRKRVSMQADPALSGDERETEEPP
jgi:hypothetical protein